jgi:tetratricopeptide (TPR) repeat protein
LQDKKYNAAMDCARQAEKAAAIPPVQAFCRFVEGAIHAEGRKFDQAAKLFEESNRLAGQSGNAMLALDSGIKLGQVLLANGSAAKAADVLQQVSKIARQVKAPAQERACTALLAQAHGNEKNFEAALNAANRTLEITKALGFVSLESIDTYNVGLFNLMMQRKTEAVALFKVAREKLPPQNNPGFLKELLFSLGMTQLQIGESQAGEQNLREALAPAAAVKDWGKVIGAHQQIAELARGRDDKKEALKHLNQALKVAEQTKNSEMRKRLKDQIKSLR